MATKLGLYNSALAELGERQLASLSENQKSRRELDRVYDDVVADCLAEGSWNFAMETIKAEADTGVEPQFGYTEVFAKPSDWVRTHGISEDEYLSTPLLHYYDDVSYWSADSSPIYIRYVSNDTGLGLELTRWTSAFRRYVELELAYRACPSITQDKELREMIERRRNIARTRAKNQDAMNEPNPKFLPPGSWTVSRGGRSSGRDRGRRNTLTG